MIRRILFLAMIFLSAAGCGTPGASLQWPMGIFVPSLRLSSSDRDFEKRVENDPFPQAKRGNAKI